MSPRDFPCDLSCDLSCDLPFVLRDSFVRDHLPPVSNWPSLHEHGSAWAYPAQLNCAVELLDRRVEEGHGERVALRTLTASCTYRQLLHRANGIARILRDHYGLIPGNRVLLRGTNHPLLVACWLGVLKAGGVVVTSMPLLRATELAQMLNKARISLALCDIRLRDELEQARLGAQDLRQIVYFNDDGADALDRLLDDLPSSETACFENILPRADEAALIAFTSGTTGQPKASVHFHRDVLAICDVFPRAILEPHGNDIYTGTSPLAFTYGLGGLLCFPLRYGASSLLLEKASPAEMLHALEKYQINHCFSVPTFWRQMAALAAGHDLSHLRSCVSAGEPLPQATRELWRAATGLEIVDGLGTTELLHIFISHKPGEVRKLGQGAIGRVLPGYEARIVDAQGKALPPGHHGRLAVRGLTGCRYLDDVRQQDYVMDGWNLTGDTGRMDVDGCFYYAARNDDIIVSAGYNIAGPEVENVLLQHPEVLDCAVVGVADAARGQIVKAYVVPHAKSKPDALLVANLQDFVKQRIAPYKYPRQVEFVDRLPRTETSKLQRYRLRLEEK